MPVTTVESKLTITVTVEHDPEVTREQMVAGMRDELPGTTIFVGTVVRAMPHPAKVATKKVMATAVIDDIEAGAA